MMVEFYEYFIFSFLTIIAIINPLTKIAIFPPLLAQFDDERKSKTIISSVFLAFGILLGASIIGQYFLSFLKIDIFSLQITGGIVLFYFAFKLITGLEKKHAHGHTKKALEEEAEDIIFAPLTFPLLVGPGSAAIGIILYTQAASLAAKAGFVGAIIVVYIINYLAIVDAEKVEKRFGHAGMEVMGKILGVLVAAIGIQFVITGIKAAFDLLL